MLILLFFIIPLQVFSVNVFHAIASRNNDAMPDAEWFLEEMWKMTETEELKEIFIKNFRFLDCDLKFHDRQTFLERYIRYSAIPKIKSAFKKDIISEPTNHKGMKYSKTWYHKYFDVELKNGKRIGFDLSYNVEEKFFGGYKIDTAIVYNCPNTKIKEVYTNIAPYFKMRKFFDNFWNIMLGGEYKLLDFFDGEFLYEGCPKPHIPSACNWCGYIKFDTYMIGFPRHQKRPILVDAIEVEENVEWQIEVLWHGKFNVYFQVKNVDGVLKFFKGKEFNCPGY